ncbi:hypothetical protein [Demequina lignilytica]|uniref:Uncharacterized protein n=1 Tax=Demequina lignilytica TaxID=3051663 RepID=A0AB35MJ07_9MICO|nr:hypothetical protein [Demequina sp. SYSU T0a273]MDN4483737.1 hypothetical protein [Demequina sp. SYSU T0a273]
MPTAERTRPGNVITVIILTWLAAILDVLGGVIMMALSRSSTFTDAIEVSGATVLISGIVSVAVGLVTGVVAAMLGAGAAMARILVSVVMVVRIAAGVYSLVLLGTGGAMSAVITLLFAVLILALLWNKASNRYFTH